MYSLSFGLVLFLLIIGFAFFVWMDGKSETWMIKKYRAKYLRLVRNLEHLTLLSNEAALQVQESQKGFLQEELLRVFKSYEVLLSSVIKLPRHGVEPSVLDAPEFLAQEYSKSLRVLRERVFTPKKAKGDVSQPVGFIAGCFFCSRPYQAAGFSVVKAKIESATKEAMVCSVCHNKLLSGRRARVLYFSEEGKTKHWSEVQGYEPHESFWSINDETKKPQVDQPKKHSHLKLISSQARLIEEP